MNNRKLVTRKILTEKRKELGDGTIELHKFRAWFDEFLLDDSVEAEETFREVIKHILFAFDDDTVEWNDGLLSAVVNAAFEALRIENPTKADDLFKARAKILFGSAKPQKPE